MTGLAETARYSHLGARLIPFRRLPNSLCVMVRNSDRSTRKRANGLCDLYFGRSVERRGSFIKNQDDGLVSEVLALWQLADISPSDNAPPVLSYLLLDSAGGLIHQCAIVISRRRCTSTKGWPGLKRTDRCCKNF